MFIFYLKKILIFQNLSSESKARIVPVSEINGHANSGGDTRIEMREETYSSSEDLKKTQNDTILKRIPQGAEATTVLVCLCSSFGYF